MSETVHGFFGLTYSSYLVLPRSVLQAMPNEWQAKLVALLRELGEAFETKWEPDGGYMVKAWGADRKFVSDPFSNYRHPPALKRRAAGSGGEGT